MEDEFVARVTIPISNVLCVCLKLDNSRLWGNVCYNSMYVCESIHTGPSGSDDTRCMVYSLPAGVTLRPSLNSTLAAGIRSNDVEQEGTSL